MRDLILAFGLLLVGFVALQMRATRDPYDYRAALLTDKQSADSLSHALEKALKQQKSSNVQYESIE